MSQPSDPVAVVGASTLSRAGAVLWKLGKFIFSVLGILALCYWTWFRYFTLAGGPWAAGHPCSSLVACREGLCLAHERRGEVGGTGPGALVSVAGYCSKRCDKDHDCPADMRCEPLPEGVSNKSGDHLPYIELPKRLCVRVTPAR